MKSSLIRFFLLVIIVGTLIGCANIVPPTGGKKDVAAPKLLSVTPADSLLNTRVTKIELRFDEYLDPSVPAADVQVSPLLSLPVTVTAIGKRVVVEIADSLLMDSTTYRVTFGNAIKDLHEGNIFSGYTYTFSTGSYFDSLMLGGTVINAATGLPDTGAFVMLYYASESDSAIVRKKPAYAMKVPAGGSFVIKGLPARRFLMYALNDANNNLVYDGEEESIAFIDSILVPADSITFPIQLSLFKEPFIDTAAQDSVDVDSVDTPRRGLKRKSISGDVTKEGFVYYVPVDTADSERRTLDVTKPINVIFNKDVDTFNKERIFLTYDSAGVAVEAPFEFVRDTTGERMLLQSKWEEDAVYTLRMLKGFATDSAGLEVMPSRYTFRTKSDDDYSKLNIHLPSKYYGDSFLLMVTREADTVHYKPVADTMVNLVKLQPGTYTIRIVKDKNKNGRWDTGDLFNKIQPEVVIPYLEAVQLKQGWENTVDFEKEEKKPAGPSPRTRDKLPSKW